MHLKISAVWTTVLFFIAFLMLATNSCKKDDKVDCSKVAGATFTSNGGNMQALLQNKCSNASCHGGAGDGTQHWTYSAEYDSLTSHFEHMYEAVVIEKEMPQAGSTQLTQEELDAFECWKQAGFPE